MTIQFFNRVTDRFEVVTGADDRLAVNASTNGSTSTTTTVSLNDVTATTIVAANPDRKFLSITLEPDTTVVDVIIRYYAAATDNIKHGVDVLSRDVAPPGSSEILIPRHVMDTIAIYDGEVSAIVDAGTVDVFVTEY